MAAPEIGSVIQTSEHLGKTVEALPQLLEQQRKGLFTEIDARQTLLTNSLIEVRQIVAGTDSLGKTLSTLTTNLQQTLLTVGDTLKTVDGIAHRYGLDQPNPHPSSQPSKPFDIQEYITAVGRLNDVVTNVNQVVAGADQFVRSEGWAKALQDATAAADQRMDRFFRNLWITMGIALVGLVVKRYAQNQISGRPKPAASTSS